MSTDTIKTAELDSTIKAKIKKIENGFKHIFKVSKSIIKKSNNSGTNDDSLSEEEQSIAQQMSAKMIDYYNKIKSASLKKSRIDLGDFGSKSSGNGMEGVENWLVDIKKKIENSGSNLNREKIFNKVMEDIKVKSPEAYKYYFSDNDQKSNDKKDVEKSENNLFNKDSTKPKKDPNKELHINENKLFSNVDIANIKVAMLNMDEVQQDKYKLYLQDFIVEFLIDIFKGILRDSRLRDKLRFPDTVKKYLDGSGLAGNRNISVNKGILESNVKTAADRIVKFLQDLPRAEELFNLFYSKKLDHANNAKSFIFDKLKESVKDEYKDYLDNYKEDIENNIYNAVIYLIDLIHALAKPNLFRDIRYRAVKGTLEEIFKKFSSLVTRIRGSYDLEDIIAAMLVGGKKDKFFNHVYSYITHSLESNVKIASDVMDKIIDEALNDEELLRKYFKAYTEGVECLLTDFVNQSGIPADTIASVLRNNYISDDILQRISEGIDNFVERGATLEEQRAIKQFIDQYQISPELAYKLVKASSKSEFIRMSAVILLNHIFAHVNKEDYKYIANDTDIVRSVLGHINSEIKKLDRKYSVSSMEIDRYGTINITIVDEGGNEKQVSNKDKDFDLDLEDSDENSDNESNSEKESDDEEIDINKEIEQAVKEAEEGLSADNSFDDNSSDDNKSKEDSKSKGDNEDIFFSGEVNSGEEFTDEFTDESDNSLFNSESELNSDIEIDTTDDKAENVKSNRLKQLFV